MDRDFTTHGKDDPACPERGKYEMVLCIHEAANVVAARHFGFPVAWVSWDQKFLEKDPLAKKNRIAGVVPEAMSMVVPSDEVNLIIQQILEQGVPDGPEEHEIIRGYCLQLFAGPCAEQHHNQRVNGDAGTANWGQVEKVCRKWGNKKIGKKGRRFWSYLMHYDELALKFVSANHETIQHFAHSLYTRKTILEGDIDFLIAQAKATATGTYVDPAAAGARP